MKIAVLGSRGVPVNYGGFETFAERISTGLVKKGYDVTVFCCKTYSLRSEETYKGIKRIIIPTIDNPKLEKLIFTILSLIHVSFTNTDVVLMLGVSASSFCFLPQLFGKKVAINIDGLEWQRKKWGWFASNYFKFSERMAGAVSDVVITDSRLIKKYYKKKYGKDSVYIPYGADVLNSISSDGLDRFGLNPGKYILQSCRLEPENNPHLVIDGYQKSKMSLPLIIVGDAPKGSKYKAKLHKMAENLMNSGKIRFLGGIYNDSYKQLIAHCAIYIHAHEVGGTNPSLLEALGAGQAPLYLDIPFNREVVGEAGFPFQKDANALASSIDYLVNHPEEIINRSKFAKDIIRERYSWDSVISQYEILFSKMVNK